MGDRIYQGFRLATDSFVEALRIVDTFRPWVQEQAENQLDAYMARTMAADKVDSISAFDKWQDRRKEVGRTRMRNPAVDTDFTVVLVPRGGILLGRVYTEQRDWQAQWYELSGVEEYSFWDNMEKPDDVSDKDWAARDKAWASLTDEPLSMQGFTIELVSPEGPMPKAWRRPK